MLRPVKRRKALAQLTAFTINLIKRAREDKIDPLIGREAEIKKWRTANDKVNLAKSNHAAGGRDSFREVASGWSGCG